MVRNVLLSIVTLLWAFWTWAQEIPKVDFTDTPLKEVLTDLGQHTGLTFSYSEEVVAGKRISIQEEAISVTQLLVLLASRSGLLFEKIGADQVIISAPISTGDLCGYLFDSSTREPLPNATILFPELGQGLTSDENGFFQIEGIDGHVRMLIQYVGYAEVSLRASQLSSTECDHIYLDPKVQSLREVVVSAYLTPGIDKNIDGSLTVLSEEQSVLSGFVEPDILQTVQQIPGITSINEAVSDIQIRGGSADQNLILYDGIKMYNTGHFFGMLSVFNPYLTEETKIYKGGANPEYGDRISGVIAIKSMAAVPKTTTAGLGLNGTHGDAYVKARLGKKIGVLVSARRSYTDVNALQTPTFNSLSEKVFQNTKIVNTGMGTVIEDEESTALAGEENFFFLDTNVKLLWQASPSDSVSLSGLQTKNDLNFSILDEDNITQDLLVVENQGLSFQWMGRKFEKLHYTLKGYYSGFDSDYNSSTRQEDELEEENLRKNTITETGLEVKLGYDLTRSHVIRAGYQYQSSEVFYQLFRDEAGDNDIDPDDDDTVDLPDETRDFNEIKQGNNQAHTVYGEYLYRPKNQGWISLGMRSTAYSLFDGLFWEPRLNIEYPISKNVRLKFTGERRYQTVSQLVEFEDTELRLSNDIWTLSDGADVPILESVQFSGGLLYHWKGWTLDIDAYSKTISGLTSFTNGFTTAAEEFSEGESDIIGVDALLKKQWGRYRIWLGYTFNDITYSFPELQTARFPGNNDVTHNFNIANSYETDRWQFSLGWTFRTGVPFTPVSSFDALEGDITYGAVNSSRLPNYHRLDASVLHKFSLSKSNKTTASFGISLQNIYAREIPLSVLYRVNPNPDTGLDELDQIEQLSLGFTPNASFRIFFN